MNSEKANKAEVPHPIRGQLKTFCDRVHDVLGDTLVSVVLYGPRAKGVAEPAPVNVMLVLRQVSTRVLDKIASFVEEGARNFGLTVMVVTELDVERSTDVFPVKFLDMQQCHVVLHGATVLDDLLIGGDNLRLRCEQETRNTLLRLRNLYLQRSTAPKQLQAVLLSALSAFLTTLNAFFFLTDGTLRQSETDIASAAERKLKLEANVLERLIQIKHTHSEVDTEELKDLFDRFLATVERSAEIIDRFTPRDE